MRDAFGLDVGYKTIKAFGFGAGPVTWVGGVEGDGTGDVGGVAGIFGAGVEG